MFRRCVFAVAVFVCVECGFASAPPWLQSVTGGIVNFKPDKDGKGALIVKSGDRCVSIPFDLLKEKKIDEQKIIFGFPITLKKWAKPIMMIEEDRLMAPEPLTPASFMEPTGPGQSSAVTLEEAEKKCKEANEQMMEQWKMFLGGAKKLAGDGDFPRGVMLRIIQVVGDQHMQCDSFVIDPDTGSVWKQE